MRALVVTADDFGAAPEVNEAVEIAHRDGILTAASLMVSGDAAADAVARARRLPSLGVGLHLVLVEGRPTLPVAEVPDLVAADGAFRTDMARLGLAIATSGRVREQVRREIDAQFAAFADTALPFDHVNAHKHFHLHPVVGRLLIQAARRFGVRAMRVPREPGLPRGSGWLVAPLAAGLARRARALGLATPDRVYGLRGTGHMTATNCRRAIDALPAGLSEIYLHPATRDDFERSTRGYEHRGEFEALVAGSSSAAVAARGVRLGTFTTLAAAS